MNKIKILLLTFTTALLVACGTTRAVPIARHKQNLIISDEQVLSLSKQEYDKYMASTTKSSNVTSTAMVRRVGRRLTRVVETYFSSHGLGEELQHYSWEFNLVADKQTNAFCMPGDRIMVYEGLLPHTQDEPSLAVVVGHEVTHTAARHGIKQMSKQVRGHLGVQVLGGVLGALGMGNTTTQTAQVVARQGLQSRNLKCSRGHGSETDNMGLIFTAMAGCDPRMAIPFWQRTASGKGNQSDMFNTHPADAKRIAALQRLIPTALQYYNGGSGTAAAPAPKTSRKLTGKRRSSRQKTVSASDLYKNTGR